MLPEDVSDDNTTMTMMTDDSVNFGTLPSVSFICLIYLKFQSIAYIFMLTFDNFCGCVGTQCTFVKKKCQKSWSLKKFDVPLQPLS